MNNSTPITQIQPTTYDHEDDETIQEVLNSFNNSSTSHTTNSHSVPPLSMQHPLPSIPPMPPNLMHPMFHSQQIPTVPHSLPHALDQMRFKFGWDKDLNIAICIAVISLLIMILPTEKIVYNYINLDKVPYSSVIVKAFLIAVSYYILSKLQ